MRISDWSSDVCSSDLVIGASAGGVSALRHLLGALEPDLNWPIVIVPHIGSSNIDHLVEVLAATSALPVIADRPGAAPRPGRSEERRVGKECVSTCRYRWAPDH